MLAAGAAYFALSALLLWPVVLDLDARLFGDYGDTRGWGWWLWAKTHGYLDGAVNPLLAAPHGIPARQVISQPLSEGLALVLARAGGEIAAMNLFILLSFPLTALATHGMLVWLGMNRWAAFIGGLAFGFAPAAVMQAAGGHAAFAFNVFVPLFVAALLHNRTRRTLASAAMVAGAFAAITFTAIYFGYFALFVAAFFVVFDVATSRDDARRIAANYSWCLLFAALMVFPVEFAAIAEQLTASRETVALAGRVRDFGDLFAFSSRPWDYLLPSIDHPIWGRFVEGFVRRNLHGSNVFEQTLYLGIVPIGLFLAGAVMWTRGRFDPPRGRLFAFFALGAVWMYFLSLPPKVGGVPTASYFAYAFAPMFRAYVRFGLFVSFFMACAAAVVLTQFALRMSPGKFRAVASLLLVVLAFDYWTLPPGHARAIDEPPAVYEWLAKQPGNALVVEYPMVRFDEAAFYTYPFWQRIHGKPLVNGASPDNEQAWRLYEGIKDLEAPGTVALLQESGVEFVLIHEAGYAEGPIPSPIKRYYMPERAALTFDGGVAPTIPPGLRLLHQSGSDKVYGLAKSADPQTRP